MVHKLSGLLFILVCISYGGWERVIGVPNGTVHWYCDERDSSFVAATNGNIYVKEISQSEWEKAGSWSDYSKIDLYKKGIWFGNDDDRGLYRSKDNGNTWKKLISSGEKIHTYYDGKEGVYIYSFERGLLMSKYVMHRYDLIKDTLELIYEEHPRVGGEMVYISEALHAAIDGVLYHSGSYIDNRKIIASYSHEDKRWSEHSNLPDSVRKINGGGKLGGRLYFSTNRGVYRFDNGSWTRTGTAPVLDYKYPRKLFGKENRIFTFVNVYSHYTGLGTRHSDQLFTSADQGETWEVVLFDKQIINSCIYQDSVVIVATTEGTYVVKEDLTVEPMFLNLRTRKLSQIAVTDSGVAGIINGHVGLHHYRFGERDWSWVEAPTDEPFYRIGARGNTLVVSSSGGGGGFEVVKTDDFGTTWNSIGYVSYVRGFKVVPNGVFMAFENQGTSFFDWETQEWCRNDCLFKNIETDYPVASRFGQSEDDYFMYFNDSIHFANATTLDWSIFGDRSFSGIKDIVCNNQYVFVFSSDSLFRSPVSSPDWTALSFPSSSINSMCVFKDSLFIASDTAGVLVSINNGETWNRFNDGILEEDSVVYQITASKNVMAVRTSSGQIYVYPEVSTSPVLPRSVLMKNRCSVRLKETVVHFSKDVPSRFVGRVVAANGKTISRFDSKRKVGSFRLDLSTLAVGVYFISGAIGSEHISLPVTVIR